MIVVMVVVMIFIIVTIFTWIVTFLVVHDVFVLGDAFEMSLEFALSLALWQRTDLHVDVATSHFWLLDLTGLPPTPEEVTAFLKNQDDEATVDRLLASPRYGERWAQHWLDVVRYADTHGFEVNTERPNAWPYRDYVIRTFNNDTPYEIGRASCRERVSSPV